MNWSLSHHVEIIVATPRPWYVNCYASQAGGDPWDDHCGIFAEGLQLAALKRPTEQEPSWAADPRANANLIVTAVNSYNKLRAENEQLRAALREIAVEIPHSDGKLWAYRVQGVARAALANHG